ncbi:Asp23/Gls24 family envelope stress response protein [Streptomyces sp. MBT33]|uniref:Asp23/Gls24 family envelope stress response protein n=1 Tax=Streptomyces sp. MBT33 TaxID=1488363 RepID=UPI00190D455F|nr:Asp23/Gls24 family envelope stress response protein [Streptomyces sp. MBT33]MBK3644036.1 Asp23/Gls24 family envelope stress response protein [Streptomyces sp. MBT33]
MTSHTDPPNSAVTPGDDDELLPCGRLLSHTWRAWEEDIDDAHVRSCPWCREAVGELDQLESAVRGLRDDAADASAWDAEPLTRRVMDVVRLELRPGRPLPLGEPAEDLWVMEAVAARVLRAAAETVPGVRAGSCRLLDGREDGTRDGTVGARLDIHAPVGDVLPDVADRVRRCVREAADRELGMTLAAVDIRVIDLVAPPADDDQEGSTP